MARTRSESAAKTSTQAIDIEGLGVFYLGRTVDTSTGEPTPEPLLFDSRRLTTHAVCVGMTGSGKTGLLVGLVEEAALDRIPTVLIDPKGDLANVLLAFPDLAASDFRPWIEEGAAEREGLTPDAFADRTAKKWAAGLTASGQSPDRIRRLRESVDMAVYTPGSRAGRPLAMLQSLEPPPAAVMDVSQVHACVAATPGALNSALGPPEEMGGRIRLACWKFFRSRSSRARRTGSRSRLMRCIMASSAAARFTPGGVNPRAPRLAKPGDASMIESIISCDTVSPPRSIASGETGGCFFSGSAATMFAA